MSSHVAYYLVALTVVLAYSSIRLVKGQSTTADGCENGDLSTSIMAEIQQQNDQQSKQLKSMYGLLVAVGRSLQVYVPSQEHDVDISHQMWNSKNIANVWDCSDIKASGQTTSGVYEVCVRQNRLRICTNAFCDMADKTGAATVFQRRKDGSVDFYRTWSEYKEGFGNVDGEFWLGNEMLYLLTTKRNYKLRIDLKDWDGRNRHADYARFSISSSADNYTLEVGGYSGDAGDSLKLHNGQKFSTKDMDNDKANSSCAQFYHGAWWYSGCHASNLNGLYLRGNVSDLGVGITWHYWLGSWYSLKSVEMKLIPTV